MKRIKISAKEAIRIERSFGRDLCGEDDGRTFYATDEDRTGVWCFDTKKERDEFINKGGKLI